MVRFILEMERGMGDSYRLCTCAFFVEPLRQVKAIRSPEYGVKSKAPFGNPERQPAISGIFRRDTWERRAASRSCFFSQPIFYFPLMFVLNLKTLPRGPKAIAF